MFGADDELNDVSVGPDGRFVAVGETGNGVVTRLVVARYLATGALDDTFGDPNTATGRRTGTAIASVHGDEHLYAVAQDSLGRIVAVGRTSGLSGDDILVVRYTAIGAARQFVRRQWRARDPARWHHGESRRA